jgi:hypothetical protein
MWARYILGVLAVVFLVLGTVRVLRNGRIEPAARTWLTIGLVFGAVSAWLWLSAVR